MFVEGDGVERLTGFRLIMFVEATSVDVLNA